MSQHIQHLEIILKISERCNINCSYCYVFNKGNSAANDSPATISKVNIEGFTRFLRKAMMDFDIDKLQIDLHGGEPLMINKGKFAWLCEQLQDAVGARLSLAIQTNGILIDSDWINLFEKYNIHAGISIDGIKEINDQFRLDKRGRSTYNGTVRGLKRLQDAYKSGRIPQPPGVLCVVNPNASGAETYRHFVDDLKLSHFDFLIPDDTYRDDRVDNVGVGRFLTSALDEWIKDNAPEIQVRIFNTYMAPMLGVSGIGVIGDTPTVDGVYAFTVGSDGLIRVDDTLRSTMDPIFDPIGHVADITLADLLSSSAMKEYEAISRSHSVECSNCVWKNLCASGRIVNRFSPARRFSNKTIYCTATRQFLSRIAAHLISMGMPGEQIEALLNARKA